MTQLHDVFSALGDATRFAIVERLLAEGEVAAGDIQQDFPISAPAVSRHLSVLHDAGLITRRVDGQRRIYSARPEALATLAVWTESHREFWSASLDRLETLILNQKDS